VTETPKITHSTGVQHVLNEHLHRYQSHLHHLGDSRNPLILGEAVETFEESFATYCAANEAVSVGNGLDALTLILQASGIGPGDEVILPSQTFHATLLAVVFAGATPIPVEVSEQDGNIIPEAVTAALSSRTAAIIPVHLHGNPCDLVQLNKIASENGLAIFDDAAQAHGAVSGLGRVGSGTTATAFSFYPTKNLGALGDGGAVTTSDSLLAQRVRALRNYGTVEVQGRMIPGRNSRLDAIQAVWLSQILPDLEAWNESRRQVAHEYLAGLHQLDITSLTPSRGVPVWHHLVVLVDKRDFIRAEMLRQGVQTEIHYSPAAFAHPAVVPFLPDSIRRSSFPTSERHAALGLSLPIHPWLSSQDIQHVLSIFADAIERSRSTV
jgi:dTDP-4-amino-4,6-dideoxygalactose transaminase